MTQAERIVDSLLEADEEKPKKKLPDWLARIKGEKTDDDEPKEGGDSKEGGEKSDAGFKGASKATSGETPGKTW